MARIELDTGATELDLDTPNSGNGDTLRDGGGKLKQWAADINAMTSDLYDAVAPETGGLLVVGDSIAALHAMQTVPTAITLNGTTTMTITSTAHSLHEGAVIYGFRTSREELNGRFTVTSVIDANTYTVTLPSAQSGTVTSRGGTGFTVSYCSQLSDRGCINWLAALNGACFDIFGVHAESGCQSSYLATLLEKSADVPYSWVAIIIGINDAAVDTPSAATAANIIACAEQQLVAGKRVIIRAIGPWDSNNASYTAARNQIAMQTNALLKAFCARTRGAYFMDSTAACTTATSTTGAVTTGALADGLHPSALGAYLDAKRFVVDYPNLLSSARLNLPVSSMQDVSVSATSRQLWPNPLMTGTSGSLQGSPAATGTAATGQVVYNQGAANTDASLVSALFGQAQRLVITATANNGGCDFYSNTSTFALAAGESVRGVAQVTVTSASGNLKSLDLEVKANFGAGTRLLTTQLYPSNTTFPQLAGETLTLVTPARLISSIAGLTSLRSFVTVRASAADTITVDVARAGTWGE